MNNEFRVIRSQAVISFDQHYNDLVDRRYYGKVEMCAASLAGVIIGTWIAHLVGVPLPSEITVSMCVALLATGIFLNYKAHHVKLTQHFMTPAEETFALAADKTQFIWVRREDNGTTQNFNLFDTSKGYEVYKSCKGSQNLYICTGFPTQESMDYAASFSQKKYQTAPSRIPSISVCFQESEISKDESAFLDSLCWNRK